MPLADGGMANVELAVGLGARNFKKLAVLKTLREELAFDPDLVAMFLSEARLCARLNHANLVQVYEVVEGPRPSIIMEYLEGLSMFDIHRMAGAKFTTAVQLRIISDVLAGLHYAHELRDYDGTPLDIIHRDVSPQNIVVTSEGRVKVLDFGIAKMANSPSYTQAGVVKGKMSYMSPEQLTGDALDRRTDVFAVGCLLWRAATGKKLWSKMPPEEIMRALVKGEIPLPSTHAEIDPRLEAIVVRATAPNRKDRFESAQVLQQAVDAYLAELTPELDLRDWMQSTFAGHWVEKRRSIDALLTDATSLPPLELNTRESVAILVPTPHSTRLITLGIVGAAVSVLLLASIAIVWHLDSRGSDQPHATNASAARSDVLLRIVAEPRTARITVGGTPLAGNPTEIRIPAGAEHEIEVSQVGYRALKRKLRFERDATLEFALVAEEPAPVASVPTKAPEQQSTSESARTRTQGAARLQRSKAKRSNCDAPFYFQDGIKIYKPECL